MKIPRLLLLAWTAQQSEAREAFLLLRAEGEMHIEQVVLLPSEPEVLRDGPCRKLGRTLWASIEDGPSRDPDTSRRSGRVLGNQSQATRSRLTTGRENGVLAEALVIWNGISRGPDEVTAHFRRSTNTKSYTSTSRKQSKVHQDSTKCSKFATKSS